MFSFESILDLCFKLKFLLFCFTKLDESTFEDQVEDVKKKFEKLYEEYVSNFNDQCASQSQSYVDSGMFDKSRGEEHKSKLFKVFLNCLVISTIFSFLFC